MANTLRTVALGLLTVGLVCFAVGTGGFATATADRGIATDTADDTHAYVGYDSPDEIRIEFSENVSDSDEEETEETDETDEEETDETDEEETDETDEEETEETDETDSDTDTTETVLVTVTNRFDTPIGVSSVDVDGPDDLNVTVTSTPTDISPADSGEIVAELECEDSFADEPLSVTIAVDGDGVEAELSGDRADRTISVTCDGES